MDHLNTELVHYSDPHCTEETGDYTEINVKVLRLLPDF